MMTFRPLMILSVCVTLAACSQQSAQLQTTHPDDSTEVAALAADTISGKWDASKLKDILNADDRLYAQRTVQDALEYNKAGQIATWRNPASGNSGTVAPERTFKGADGGDCRTFSTAIYAAGTRYTSNATACRERSGQWKVQG